jgi:transcriptional regulator with XRE-family HTH domain
MARAALGWNVRDLGRIADVAPTTVNRFEMGRAIPIPATMAAIQRAFEAAGIKFIENGVIFVPPSDVPLEAIKQQEEQKALPQPTDAGKTKEDAASIDKSVTLDLPLASEQEERQGDTTAS